MASSSAPDPDAYLAELPGDRAAELGVVRDLVTTSVPDGIVEAMGFGMITWVVPLAVYPDTYNRAPLMYAALAAQKNYSSLYLMCLYAGGGLTEDAFRARWSGGRRLDMGRSCVRFRRAADLDHVLVREVLGSWTSRGFVAAAKAARSAR